MGYVGVDSMNQVEEAHFALGPDGQYMPVPVMPQIPHPSHELAPTDSYPQGQTGGQTFAATALLAFASTPLLKQHIMASLHMSNEEIASLEPILAAAWDQWDNAVSIVYFLIVFSLCFNRYLILAPYALRRNRKGAE